MDARPLGDQLSQAEVVTRPLGIPTIAVGVLTLDDAKLVVRSGQADMVSMVRATIADPHLVRKSRDGSAGLVRLCINSSEGASAGR